MTEPTKERPLDDRAMQSTFYRKQIRLVLRHGRTVEGNIHVTEGQSLTISLAARRFLVNLTEVHWRDAADEIEHIAIRVDQILWAAPIHSSIAVTHGLPPVDHARRAELGFDDGTVIEVALYIAQEQRLTDYIDTACGFMAVVRANNVTTGEALGPVTVNTGRIQTIREIRGTPAA
jgi:hypothetical protein